MESEGSLYYCDENRVELGKKTGDIEKERLLEDRLRQLGLLDTKRKLERDLAHQLSSTIDSEDVISRTMRKTRRRRRKSGTAPTQDLRNIIKQKIVRDKDGIDVLYEIVVLMGGFTQDVSHQVFDFLVTVHGTTRSVLETSCKLTKEISIELPTSVDMAGLSVVYGGGAVTIQAPFK